jgi:hypothetical protein
MCKQPTRAPEEHDFAQNNLLHAGAFYPNYLAWQDCRYHADAENAQAQTAESVQYFYRQIAGCQIRTAHYPIPRNLCDWPRTTPFDSFPTLHDNPVTSKTQSNSRAASW